MNNKEKEKLIDILTNGIDVTDFNFMDANKVIKNIIDFIHKEEDDFFCWQENQNLFFSKGRYTGEIFLEVHSDAFIFKLNVEGSPYNVKTCARFVSLILKYLGELSLKKIEERQEVRKINKVINEKNNKKFLKNIDIKDIKSKIKRLKNDYYKK